MRAQDAFDELVARHIWPGLKERGFRRSKSTFHRSVGANWEVINVQRSVYSDRDEVRFTVNLAVGISLLRGGVRTWVDGKRPSASRCHFGERLGILLRGEDTWWTVTPDTNVVELADSVSFALERFGLPWLEARSTDEQLRILARGDLSGEYQHHLYFLAQLMGALGDEEAKAAVDGELRSRGVAGLAPS